jgi:hypothetical protein
MAMNRIQFQPGLSMPEFFKLYGTPKFDTSTPFSAHFQG